MALAKSANVVFAKMAVKHLDGDDLRKEAERFLFNRPIFDQPVQQSKAEIPDNGLDFAKSAAGFGEVKLSPLHAALIAAAVGNGGIAEEPSLIDALDGQEEPPTGSMRLMNPETAAALRDMMKLTVSEGTATNSFRERHHKSLGDIQVAGKTGSLSTHGERPFKDYSWFVGFAPADDPKIAVAAVVVNGLKWRIHAPFIAREALKAYLVGGPLGQPPAARRHWRHRRKRS
jgi:cell division protein FtsI/penicillin-binding protein 2